MNEWLIVSLPVFSKRVFGVLGRFIMATSWDKTTGINSLISAPKRNGFVCDSTRFNCSQITWPVNTDNAMLS